MASCLGNVSPQIVAVVHKYCASDRQLRRIWRQLARDILAILGRLRFAVLLDYTVMSTEKLQPLVSYVRAIAAEAGAGKFFCIFKLEDCCYLADCKALLLRCDANLCPKFITFDSAPQPTSCSWASTEGTQAFLSSLQHLKPALQHSLHVCEAAPISCHTVQLDSIPSLPCLPTLNGFLLGYPVCYAMEANQVDAVAESLSAQTLCLYNVTAFCPALQEHSSPVSGTSVCSFTVPQCLMSDDPGAAEQLLGSWMQSMRKRAALGGMWTDLQLAVSNVQHIIVL